MGTRACLLPHDHNLTGDPLDTGGGEGVCLYDSPSGDLSVFMVNIGNVREFALRADRRDKADGCSHTDGVAATAAEVRPRRPRGRRRLSSLPG